MLKKLWSSLLSFLKGGTASFHSGEMFILNAVLQALPSDERLVFAQQIEAISLVQRPQPGRMTIGFYRKPASIRALPYQDYEHCLAEVQYSTQGKVKKTNIMLHRGRLQSIERSIPAKSFLSTAKPRVTLHPIGVKSVAEEIDAEEHGAGA